MSLTESQKKAVQTTHKNILVSAGAGTGKTHVLVERILHLHKTQKAAITELLVLTFTEKAANEIKTRLSQIFQDLKLKHSQQDLEESSIATFHSFASRLLKEHPVEAGVDPDFRVLEAEQAELLKEEALQETFKKFYKDQEESFELLTIYGKGALKEGILKVFTAARHEGKWLADFFSENAKNKKNACAEKEKNLGAEAALWMKKLEGIDTADWARFYQNPHWDWETFRAFETWRAAYQGKRKAGWKEWRDLLETLAALRLDVLVAPWQEKFERMAMAFEDFYGGLKKEKGFLDFDDLQMKAVGLFRGETPALRKLLERYQKKFKFVLIDEFQDTNFLQMEFAELLGSGQNLFFVGDYKQSIYSFRGAEPGIFLEKEKLFAKGEAGERIFLSESFRSEPPLLEFVNRFFKILWEEDDFPFEPLKSVQAPKSSSAVSRVSVEVLVTEPKENEDMGLARLREARALAARIREMHAKEKIPYGDIAILFQAMTLSGIYEDAFKSADIPYFIVTGRGFYEQPEIQDIMSFLAHLETPLADIPLAATLRSPLFHITDDTIFWLSNSGKTRNEKIPLWEIVKDFEAVKEIEPEQKEKLHDFRTVCGDLRRLKDRIPVSELVGEILERTGYELSLLTDPAGVRRYANLKKLVSMIRQYETFERISLAAFLNILKRFQAQEVRESEAQIALESSAQAVRMMSVHAAKGLEFPVVVIADMGHQGSRSDSKTVIAHAADGYAMQLWDTLERTLKKPYFFLEIDETIKQRDNEEWKRLLYVAMTRAKARLLLSGVYKKRKETKDKFSEMNSWMDWVMTLCDQLPVKVSFQDKTNDVPHKAKFSAYQEAIRKILERIPKQTEKKQLQKPLLLDPPAVRPFLRVMDLPVSAYVLFQKDPLEFWRVYQIGWSVNPSEEFAKGQDLDEKEEGAAADFGTAMHTFFEHLDFKQPEFCLRSGILESIFSGFETEKVDQAQELIRQFFSQPLFQKLYRAKQIKREVDFVLNGRHGLIYGKLDMLFEDEHGLWHILDYKTAVGDERSAEESGYLLQLQIYALAVEKLLGISVCSGILYFLKNQKEVTLDFAQTVPADDRKKSFQRLEKKILDLQKSILEFSNAKWAEV